LGDEGGGEWRGWMVRSERGGGRGRRRGRRRRRRGRRRRRRRRGRGEGRWSAMKKTNRIFSTGP
jgi:hypothetical protein